MDIIVINEEKDNSLQNQAKEDNDNFSTSREIPVAGPSAELPTLTPLMIIPQQEDSLSCTDHPNNMADTISKPVLWCCSFCETDFTQEKYFTQHTQSYHPMCTICKLLCNNMNTLQSHHKTEHPDAYFECPQCKNFFTSARSLGKHRRLYKSYSNQCLCEKPNCGRTFHTKKDLWRHDYMEHMDMKCIICAQGICTQGLSIHLSQTHRVKSIDNVIWKYKTKTPQMIQNNLVAKRAINVPLQSGEQIKEKSEDNYNSALSKVISTTISHLKDGGIDPNSSSEFNSANATVHYFGSTNEGNSLAKPEYENDPSETPTQMVKPEPDNDGPLIIIESDNSFDSDDNDKYPYGTIKENVDFGDKTQHELEIKPEISCDEYAEPSIDFQKTLSRNTSDDKEGITLHINSDYSTDSASEDGDLSTEINVVKEERKDLDMEIPTHEETESYQNVPIKMENDSLDGSQNIFEKDEAVPNSSEKGLTPPGYDQDFDCKEDTLKNILRNTETLQFDGNDVPLKIENNIEVEQTIITDDNNINDNSIADTIKPDLHKSSDPCYCSHCGVHFICMEHYKSHNMSFHPICKTCNVQFKDLKSMKSHNKKEHSFQECPTCKGSFASTYSLLEHFKSFQNYEIFECNTANCDQVFHTGSELRKHKYTEHISTKCMICGLTIGLPRYETLNSHLKSLHDVELIKGRMTRLGQPKTVASPCKRETIDNPDIDSAKKWKSDIVPPSFLTDLSQRDQIASNSHVSVKVMGEGSDHASHEETMNEYVKEQPGNNILHETDRQMNKGHAVGDINFENPTVEIVTENIDTIEIVPENVDAINPYENCPVIKEEDVSQQDLEENVNIPQVYIVDGVVESDIVKSSMEIVQESAETITTDDLETFHLPIQQDSFQLNSQESTVIAQGCLVGDLVEENNVNPPSETVPYNAKTWSNENHFENFKPHRKDNGTTGSRLQREKCAQFQCRFCGVNFIQEVHCWQHVHSHHPSCTRCNIHFPNIKQLQAHEEVIHSYKACSGCNVTFRNFHELKTHITSLQDSALFHCEKADCSFVFHTKDEHSRHFFEEHVITKCIICAQGIQVNTTLEEHLKGVHRTDIAAIQKSCRATTYPAKVIPEYVKPIIDKNDSSNNLFTIEDNPYQPDLVNLKCYCNFCDITFIKNQHFQLHVESHHPFCQKCNVHLYNEKGLQSHQKSVHSMPSCPLCMKCFATSEDLNNHIMSLTNSMLFKCDSCGLIFHTQDELFVHDREHTPINSVRRKKCFICGNNPGNSTMKTHLEFWHQVVITKGKMTEIPKREPTIVINVQTCRIGAPQSEQNVSSELNIEPPSAKKMRTDNFEQSSTPAATQVSDLNEMPKAASAVTCSKCSTCFLNKVQWERHIWKCKKM